MKLVKLIKMCLNKTYSKVRMSMYVNAAESRYLRMTVTNQNFIQKEIKRRMNLGNACYHSIQNLLSSHLQLKA
jgi:hypothetical protein